MRTMLAVAAALMLAGCGGSNQPDTFGPATETTTARPTTTLDRDVTAALASLDELEDLVQEAFRQLQHGGWRATEIAADRAGDSCDEALVDTIAALGEDHDQSTALGLSCALLTISFMPEIDEDQGALWARSRQNETTILTDIHNTRRALADP